MRRFQLIEIEDQPWCPAVLRDAATDFLRLAIHAQDLYGPAVERLAEVFRHTGATQVVDLCSGGGGPWRGLRTALAREGVTVEVIFTDRYPNIGAWAQQRAEAGAWLHWEPGAVDATAVPTHLRGFRTLFSSFHHFPPASARAIIADAVQQGVGIAIFEGTHRSASVLLLMFLVPLLVLLGTPLIRPFRWSRLFWTYVVPLVPLIVLVDGFVSCLRTYSSAELRAMVATLPGAQAYTWQIGEQRGHGPLPITYLIGYPSGCRQER